jgi:hypothetical protein
LRHAKGKGVCVKAQNDWQKQWPLGLLLYIRGVHHSSTTKSQVRSICVRQKDQMQAAHMAITVKEEGSKVYIRVTAKVGVILSNKVYYTGSLRGEHKARGMRYMWRQLET